MLDSNVNFMMCVLMVEGLDSSFGLLFVCCSYGGARFIKCCFEIRKSMERVRVHRAWIRCNFFSFICKVHKDLTRELV